VYVIYVSDERISLLHMLFHGHVHCTKCVKKCMDAHYKLLSEHSFVDVVVVVIIIVVPLSSSLLSFLLLLLLLLFVFCFLSSSSSFFWHYSPWWTLASSTIVIHSSWSCDLCLQFLMPTTALFYSN